MGGRGQWVQSGRVNQVYIPLASVVTLQEYNIIHHKTHHMTHPPDVTVAPLCNMHTLHPPHRPHTMQGKGRFTKIHLDSLMLLEKVAVNALQAFSTWNHMPIELQTLQNVAVLSFLTYIIASH